MSVLSLYFISKVFDGIPSHGTTNISTEIRYERNVSHLEVNSRLQVNGLKNCTLYSDWHSELGRGNTLFPSLYLVKLADLDTRNGLQYKRLM